MSVSRKDDKRREEAFPGVNVADIERGAFDPTYDSGRTAEIETSEGSARVQRQRILHRVPPQVREKNKHIYEPLVVSLGPYHHGKPQFRQFEEFKHQVLDIVLISEGGAKDKRLLFHRKLVEGVAEIRSFYGGLSTKEYDDDALIAMMFRDACLVLYYMEITVGNLERTFHVNQSIGLLGLTLMTKDYSRLENQIPWWIIKFLISLIYKDDEGAAFICKFFSYATFGDYTTLKQVPWKEGTEKEPLHLLEALRITNLKEEINGNNSDKLGKGSLSCPTFILSWWRSRRKSSKISLFELLKRPFRSATELRAKGIYFRPSSYYLNDIWFSSHSFYGVLHLPVLVVDRETMTFFSNIVVMEMSPGSTNTDFPVTSYVNFMKSLIENPKDAKLLQENGILFSYLEDNEQIVRMFNGIDTHGVDNFYIFDDIKERINEHCNSKAKTWIAELILTKFRTPWTAIAFFAAFFLLCLTFLQTYYTMNPRNTGN